MSDTSVDFFEHLKQQAVSDSSIPVMQILAGAIVGHAAIDLNLSKEDLLKGISALWDALAPNYDAIRAAIATRRPGETLTELHTRVTPEIISTAVLPPGQ